MTISICSKSHEFTKTIHQPVCPICWAEYYEQENKIPFSVGAPALRVLLHNKIFTLEQLTSYSEKEILSMHGVGPKAMKIIKSELGKYGMSFRK